MSNEMKTSVDANELIMALQGQIGTLVVENTASQLYVRKLLDKIASMESDRLPG